MVTAGSELLPGTSVDRRYRIQCTLGRGGFGRTYLAADERRFGELCVLKEFVPNSEADPIVAEKLRELFQREATILHKLDHPQIPQFFAGFEEDDRLFIAQEYIDGKTYWRLLQERQRYGHKFSQGEIIEWLRDLLPVLSYLHSQNIVHRDISPDNIMLPQGHKKPVLIDFGVVKQVIPHLHLANPNDGDGLIQASVSVGKFGYAPYEQIQMGQCSPRSDLYALGVTAIVLLTAKPPNLLIDAKSLEWQWQRCVKLDRRLIHILHTMTADKPQDRYPSAAAVLQDLQPLCEVLDLLEAPTRVQKSLHSTTSTEPVTSIKPVEPDWLKSPQSFREADPHTAAYAAQAINTASITTELDLAVSKPVSLLPPEQDALPTKLEAAIVPVPNRSSALTSTSVDTAPASIKTWINAIWALMLRLPQDQLGNSKPLRLSVQQLAVLGILALLPIGGIIVGIRSPYIASICNVLENCVGKQTSEDRYLQAIAQADKASILSEQARNLYDLQNAREHLTDSIAQLHSYGSTNLYGAAQNLLPQYQTLLQTLDHQLEKETRAAQLLNRAEAEAQKAIDQTSLAKSLQQFQAAQLEWKRALSTLAAISDGTFVADRATARVQEYKARLDAVTLKVAAMTPKPVIKVAASPAPSAMPSPPQAQFLPVTAANAPVSTPRSAPAPQPARPAQKAQPAPKQQPSRTPARSTQPAAPRASAPATRPQANTNTSPLEIDRRWIAGSVVTSATQTLDNVAIWIDGKRTAADGRFVANLWIQNRSGRGFGFVPLYAESKDSNGQTVRSRVLFTGTADTMLEPGEGLNGQIYLLDRPTTPQRLTLIIQESTHGARTFRIPF